MFQRRKCEDEVPLVIPRVARVELQWVQWFSGSVRKMLEIYPLVN